MRITHVTGSLIALTAVICVAGCGANYTKRDFLARADGICNTAVREIRSIAPPASPAGQPEAVAVGAYFKKLVPIAESEVAQLRALRRPPGSAADAANLSRYLHTLAGDAGVYRQLGVAAASGDSTGVASAEAQLRASPVAGLAAAYGLRQCGNAGGTGVPR
jgi:hypothetical protein